MKHIFLLLLFVGITILTSAQIGVGLGKTCEGRLDEENVALLRKTTTLFVYTETDIPYLPQYEKALRDAWTITKYRIIPFDSLRRYISRTNFSFFSINGLNLKRLKGILGETSQEGFEDEFLYLQLWMNRKKKNDKLEQIYFAKIELYPDAYSYGRWATSYSTYIGPIQKKTFFPVDSLYATGRFYNLKPGFLKTYLELINTQLLKLETHYHYKQFNEEESLKRLATDTLFLPDYISTRFNPYTLDDNSKIEDEDLLSEYKFPYKFIPTDELSEKILKSGDEFHYLVFVKSSSTIYITVFNSKTSKIVYSRKGKPAWNIKKSDFEELSKSITKVK